MPVELIWTGVVVLIMAAGGALVLVPWHTLLEAGDALGVLSVLVGIPLELVYFAALAWCLRGRGAPKDWYWRSFAYHHLLTKGERWLVMPWFILGALCFLGAVLGIFIVFLGAIATMF